MPKGKRICKVCGKEYEYCHTLRRDPNMFRWQDVACCEAHGAEYLKMVIASRQKTPVAQEVEAAPAEAQAEEETPKKRSRKQKTAVAEEQTDEEMA